MSRNSKRGEWCDVEVDHASALSAHIGAFLQTHRISFAYSQKDNVRVRRAGFMLQKHLRLALWLNIAAFIMIILILLIPWRNDDLEQFVLDMQDCEAACLLDIRPNETSIGSAIAILSTHPWVEEVSLRAPGTGYGEIRWLWSGRQSAWIDTNHRGRITFYWDNEEPNAPELDDAKVETVSVYTHLHVYDLQNWYGMPDSGVTSLRGDQTVNYAVAYHDQGMAILLSTVIRCPASALNLWNAKTRIGLSIGFGTSDYVPYFALKDVC